MTRTTAAPSFASTLSRRRLLGAALAGSGLGLAGCAGQALAHPQRLATLELVDRDSGFVLPTYGHDGRRYVAGRPGARYALRLRNFSGGRVLVVLSVDGINVITGETADWQQSGYVLAPGQWADITGWRKSQREVAAFEFAPLEHSYAALTGRASQVGVVGMAVFRERVAAVPVAPPVAPQVPPPLIGRRERGAADAAAEPRAAAPAAPSTQAGAARDSSAAPQAREADAMSGARKSLSEDSARLGTGHGARETSYSHRTTFERASRAPAQVTEIEYDSHERLVAAGIIPGPYAHGRPRAFPAQPDGFVPDPPAR